MLDDKLSIIEFRLLLGHSGGSASNDVLGLQLRLIPRSHPLQRVVHAVVSRIVHRQLSALYGHRTFRSNHLS